jgi:hypothetical protein
MVPLILHHFFRATTVSTWTCGTSRTD